MKKLIGVIVVLVLVLVIAFQPRIKEQQKYSIVFYSNGGSAIDTISVISNSTVYEPKAPTRIASAFVGWYLNPDFSEESKYDFNTKITKSITLYAKWDNVNFNIIYTLGEGFWPSQEVEDLYVKELDFDSNIVYFKFGSTQSPVHPGGRTNAFQGWRTISQEDYNNLTSDEKKKYPYIEKVEPKKDDLQAIFGEGTEIVLYAHYRNK